MENIMSYWCTDCAISALIIYGSMRYGLLSNTPEYFAIQIFGISLAAKPITALVLAQAEKMGLKGSVTTM